MGLRMEIKTVPTKRAADWIPPLENGDHLTASEFHRRYEAMPENIRAELIEGIVHLSSPVRHYRHGKPHVQLSGWILAYAAATPQVDYSDNATVFLAPNSEAQPDLILRLEPQNGGNSRVLAEDYIQGAPELIIEIAASSASIDLYEKRTLYEKNGVHEYIVWRTEDHALDWFRLRAGKYERVEPDAEGLIRSEVFPGLWLAVNKLLAGDLAGVLAELQKGIASPEHAAFVEKLTSQA